MTGIFALVCPECGVPLEDHPDDAAHAADAGDVASSDDVAHDVADDVNVCVACTCTFVVRFGYAFAVPHPTDRGAA